MKWFLYLLFTASCLPYTLAQKIITYKDTKLSKTAFQNYNKGRELLQKEKTNEALKYFHKAVEAEPRFIDAQLLLADTYYELKQYTRARAELEKVIAMDTTYMPRMFYSLGKYCEKAKLYNDAALYYERYARKDKGELGEKAALLAAHNRFRHQAYQTPVDFKPKNMGDSINTSLPEYLPSITADGQTLIYTVKEGRQEDFYVSKKVNGVWRNSLNLGAPINTDENEGAQSISADGKLLVYTACNRTDGLGSCDLYFSELKNGQWTTPQNMGAPINTAGWESQPGLSADGSKLYFASSTKDGKNGGKNIFYATRDAAGHWSVPQPVSELNTPYDDESPFLHPDGETMYFSSNGHPGFGEGDIFVTRKQPDGKWGKPKNLGYPINTDKNEVGLVITLDGKTAIYAAEFADTHGGLDLYTFDLPTEARAKPVTYISAKVIDDATEKPLRNVVATLREVQTNTEIAVARTDEKGSFLLCLPAGKMYSLTVEERGYVFYSDNFELTNESSFEKPYSLAIRLQPVRVAAVAPTPPKTGEPPAPPKTKAIILKNVFFATGSTELKPESQAELNRLYDLLKENPNFKIQINGHTDNVGSDATNLTLSDGRANAVRSYLIKRGIDAARLAAKGFGETQPIDTNDTEAGRKNNRRTEFVVL